MTRQTRLRRLAALGLVALAACAPGLNQPVSDPIAVEVQRRALASCAQDGATGRDCVPLVLCFIGPRNAFVGHSNPSRGGRLSVTDGRGQTCTGNWLATSNRRTGRLAFQCSDGRSGEFQFRAEIEVIGGNRIDATTETGERFSAWSGRSVWRSFEDERVTATGRACVARSFGL